MALAEKRRADQNSRPQILTMYAPCQILPKLHEIVPTARLIQKGIQQEIRHDVADIECQAIDKLLQEFRMMEQDISAGTPGGVTDGIVEIRRQVLRLRESRRERASPMNGEEPSADEQEDEERGRHFRTA